MLQPLTLWDSYLITFNVTVPMEIRLVSRQLASNGWQAVSNVTHTDGDLTLLLELR